MDLHYISAVEAIKKFKDKSLSPVELINSIIERSEKINPKINAHNFTFYEKAIECAKKSEQTNEAILDKVQNNLFLGIFLAQICPKIFFRKLGSVTF